MKKLIKEILEKATPEKIQEEIASIQKIVLPPHLQGWVDSYEKVGERDRFTWKIFFRFSQEIHYVSGIQPHQKSLQEIRFLITMFIMLLDDIVDQNQSTRLLNKLLKIPFTERYSRTLLNSKEKEYFNFTLKVWCRFNRLIEEAPQYERLKDIFFFDIQQIVNAMEYSHLINNNVYLINKTEYWLYPPHTMQLVAGAFIDIMHLSKLRYNELGIAREIIWQALKMARIGNCLGTWEREMNDNDFTSGIYAYAINLGILNSDDLSKPNKETITIKIKESIIENQLFDEWEKCYREILKLGNQITIINVAELLRCLEKLLTFEIIHKSQVGVEG